MKNKLVIIGFIGQKVCYLNVDKDEALKRYCEQENITLEEFEESSYLDIRETEFDDSFEAYAIFD